MREPLSPPHSPVPPVPSLLPFSFTSTHVSVFILNLIFHRYPSAPAHGSRYHVIDVHVHVYTYKLHVHECVTRLRRENKVLYVRKTPVCMMVVEVAVAAAATRGNGIKFRQITFHFAQQSKRHRDESAKVDV